MSISQTGTPRGAERRKYARVPHEVPIRYEDRAGKRYEAKTVNVSPFGMLIDSPTAFHPEALLRLHVDAFEGGPPIDVTCIVTRSEPHADRHHASVAFINLTRQAFEHLKQLVDRSGDGKGR